MNLDVNWLRFSGGGLELLLTLVLGLVGLAALLYSLVKIRTGRVVETTASWWSWWYAASVLRMRGTCS